MSLVLSPSADRARVETPLPATVVADVPVPIRATTRIYPVVGSPIAQVKAPMLYNELFARTGFDAAVVPMEIAPDEFATVMRALLRVRNVPGAFVTIPHKTATVDLLDDCSVAVRVAGACNAVKRRADGTLYGELFDGIGFVRAAEAAGFRVPGSRCIVVGAGGAGAAIAAALAQSGAAVIRLFDTRTEHARELVAHLQQYFASCRIETGANDLAGFDLVVNATPLGMEPGDPLPIDASQLTNAMTVGEIVMKREVTALVAAARSRGCRTVLGKDMLRCQMPLYLEFFGMPANP